MSDENFSNDIVLRDLQSLLRNKLTDQIIVDNFTTKSLLPFGENYGSTILNVEATIRRDDDAKKEDLHLIAKMLPPTAFQRELFNSPYTFKKEIAMYEKIAPLYKRLEIENKIEDELLDVWPKIYGSRLAIDPNVEFDENAVILMENLQALGYYTCNRFTGIDIEHARFALRTLAKFHAFGMGVKEKHPEEFELLKGRSKSSEFNHEGWENVPKVILKKMSEDPEILPYYSRCESALYQDMLEIWTMPPKEPWSTIIHADFWVNNIMFHRNKLSGRVDDTKFVDFQNYLFFSPLRELIFFLFSSVQINVFEDHFDELIKLYHDNLLCTLNRLNCNTEPYSLEHFNDQLTIDAKREFSHISFMLRILTLDMKKTDYKMDDIENILKNYEGNREFSDRLRAFILFFVKKNWI